MLQLLIKNGNCVNPSGEFQADIAVSDGKIVRIGQAITENAERVIDAAGQYVMPGIIDAHVHLPPGHHLHSIQSMTTYQDRLRQCAAVSRP